MITDIEKLTDLLVKHKITANQYLLCYYLGYDDATEVHHLLRYNSSSMLNRYQTLVGGWLPSDFKNLKEQGLLLDNNKPGESKISCYKIADFFKRELFIGKEEAFEEFLDLYPIWLPMENGKNLPARTGDFEELSRIYGKVIGAGKANHEKIIAVLKKAIEFKLVTQGLDKVIRSRQWEVWHLMIEKLGLEEGVKSNGQFRTI